MLCRNVPMILLLCFAVVPQIACGDGGGGATPAEDTNVTQDTAPEIAHDTPCEPACDEKQCGDDGCGGTCGSCAATETCTEDGACEVECGNGHCKAFETCSSCPADCGDCCGNGSCDGGWGETCDSCPADCACDYVGACSEGECLDCLDTVAMEGGFAWDCGENEDCNHGLCATHEEATFCTCNCMESTDCPEDWACEISDIFGTDIMFVCVPCAPNCEGKD